MNGDHAYPKHIYATGDPETCPILALALFVFMLSKATPRLFGKSGAQKKFRQWFEAFVKKNHDELQGMGVSPPSIGMHHRTLFYSKFSTLQPLVIFIFGSVLARISFNSQRRCFVARLNIGRPEYNCGVAES